MKAVPSLSSMIISNIFATVLFGGTTETGGVGMHAAIVPEPTGVRPGAVADVSILVSVPGQAQVVSFILRIFRLCQSLTYLVLNFCPL